jgi:hypothetical protein
VKPYVHAKASAARYGGTPEEYLFLHDFMDSTKAACADVRHRAVLHSAFGIFIVEKVYGTTYTNSIGKVVSIRDLAEDHVKEDLGCIPSLESWVKNMPIEDWMMGRGKAKGEKRHIPMEDEKLMPVPGPSQIQTRPPPPPPTTIEKGGVPNFNIRGRYYD